MVIKWFVKELDIYFIFKNKLILDIKKFGVYWVYILKYEFFFKSIFFLEYNDFKKIIFVEELKKYI